MKRNHPNHKRPTTRGQSCLDESTIQFIASTKPISIRYARHNCPASQQNDRSTPGPNLVQEADRA